MKRCEVGVVLHRPADIYCGIWYIHKIIKVMCVSRYRHECEPVRDIHTYTYGGIVRNVETEKGARYKRHGETHPLFMRHGWFPNEHA